MCTLRRFLQTLGPKRQVCLSFIALAMVAHIVTLCSAIEPSVYRWQRASLSKWLKKDAVAERDQKKNRDDILGLKKSESEVILEEVALEKWSW